MNRWWFVVVLLFSVGINVGILATLAVNKMARSSEPVIEQRQPALPPRIQSGQELQQPRLDMPHLERMADHLDLEGEDRERFLEIQRAFFQEVSGQRREMEQARRELMRELISEAPDRARAEQLMQRSALAHAALERALVTNVLDSREVLGPDQEREFAIIIKRIAQGPGDMGNPPNVGPYRRGDRDMRSQDRPPNRPEGRKGGVRRDRP